MSERDPEIVAPGQGRRRESGEFVSQPAKLLRIASMIRELLQDVRQSSVDEAGRKRLRGIYDRAMGELKEGLSEDLQHELGTLTIPLEGTPSESEIRIAQAQLVGWLEGLFQGIQAALWAQHMQARAQFLLRGDSRVQARREWSRRCERRRGGARARGFRGGGRCWLSRWATGCRRREDRSACPRSWCRPDRSPRRFGAYPSARTRRGLRRPPERQDEVGHLPMSRRKTQ